ncbi:hypothetical protein [Bradyrhizobium sp.]|uniref:hypothetical protein n=1 Tax=Bradyrhizobium sp. TaxID=376 RepID=UPI0025C45AA4|nr:hypothetical protein [Bradyrhizobium sp.]
MDHDDIKPGAAMQTKLIALLVAGFALSGCCASGTGCPSPSAGMPLAWDGLGEAPTADGEPGTETRPKRSTARSREIIVGPLIERRSTSAAQSRPEEQWTRGPVEDREADARLSRQIMICRDC